MSQNQNNPDKKPLMQEQSDSSASQPMPGADTSADAKNKPFPIVKFGLAFVGLFLFFCVVLFGAVKMGLL